jgi:hypothetical protein
VADDLVQRFRSALARVVVHPLHHFGDVITDAYVCRKADWVVIEQHADALARKDAETAAANAEIDELVRALKLCTQRAERAEARVRELEQRIAEAERFDAAMLLALGIPVSQDDAFAAFALVLLDTEEAK